MTTDTPEPRLPTAVVSTLSIVAVIVLILGVAIFVVVKQFGH